MTISQLSVFAENSPGIIYQITERIAAANIDIRAISVSDTQDFGILRVVVSDAERAKAALGNGDFVVTITQVLGIEIPDKPGGLANVLALLSENKINVDYIYAFVTISGKSAYVVMRVNDNEKAEELLKRNGIHMLTQAEIENF